VASSSIAIWNAILFPKFGPASAVSSVSATPLAEIEKTHPERSLREIGPVAETAQNRGKTRPRGPEKPPCQIRIRADILQPPTRQWRPTMPGKRSTYRLLATDNCATQREMVRADRAKPKAQPATSEQPAA